jgi:hypothetical protein
VSASSDLRKRSLWRLRDGDDWSVDVVLDDDLAHGDAEVVVQAIRRGTLVNRVPAIDLGGGKRLEFPIPEVDATNVSSILRDPKFPGGYVVTIGRAAGTKLSVRIVNGVVEVYALSSWNV